MTDIELRMTEAQWTLLSDHLFPGDLDEHGAVVLAGVAHTANGIRLIAREVLLARDRVDYVAGQRGYRMLTADFVHAAVDRAAEEHLAYIAVHCHGGTTSVALSDDDRQSQQRGYPAILDILNGSPVAGAVFASKACAADVWFPGRTRDSLDRVVVSGAARLVLTPSHAPRNRTTAGRYERQALLFGAAGQDILRHATVVVAGLGGVGSILVELLARLGVGHLILIDDDIVEASNLPRLLGSVRRDAMVWLTDEKRPAWVRRRGRALASSKVRVATRAARRANPDCQVIGIRGDVADADVARRLTHADYLFLAADTFRARLVCNAIAFQYGIPGVQLGAKVRVRPADGSVTDVYSVVRPFGPEQGCLWCNDLIPPARLAEEAVSSEQRAAQKYVEDDEVAAPSVISLNAVAAAHAVNDFLMHLVGLRTEPDVDYLRFLPLTGDIEATTPRRNPGCTECGDDTRSRRARGDTRSLPTIHRSI